MNWDDLKVFLAVARTESLSGAGRQLKIDPATVGRRIARLEEGLGVALFAKSPQGYDLTRDGARLLSHAEAAEQAVAFGAEDMSGEGDRGLKGVIRVGAPDGCANYVLPRVIARIAEAHPDLEVQIVAQPRLFNLSKREVDFVVSVSAPTSGRLLVQKITDYHLSLAGMKWYMRQHGEVSGLEDLSTHKMVGYVPDLIFDKELDYLEEIGVSKVDYTSNSVSVQLNMIRAGLGLGVVHDFCLPYVPRLTRLLPDQIRLKRAFYLVRHADDRKVERLSRFADMLAVDMRAVVESLEAET
ncbi:MAG: LysR family transcriptional regulator [Alphaproteobacteria bacterium]|nr:LysR family transcriptional regulator [Alphaproteobacteria bacterium]MBU1278514.1 LysR family transcriptional regulator [Alphaproteobacteria bacterium]MBU1571869.1 LysR family transcriptional regulator [Alphaproteobacteria bacterium]MBU1828680.1 LysR family transcriptional regulator [Alphaproteobacteria bacterium]MBU2079894.1 LysR family transcriptional regulator [Alphaproteobacteria bacterium]